MGVEFSVQCATFVEREALESEGVPSAHMAWSNFRAVMVAGFGVGEGAVGMDCAIGLADPEWMLERRGVALAWAADQPVEWVAGGGWMNVMEHRVVEVLAVCEVAQRLGRAVSWA